MKYRMLTKRQTNVGPDGRKTGWRFDGVIRSSPIGDFDDDDEFWTNNIESANRTARCQNRRVARRTIAFSKRLEPHIHQFAFWVFYHNYAAIPKRRRLTPAMEAGVVNRLFDSKDIVRLIARYQKRAREEHMLSRDDMVLIPTEPVIQPREPKKDQYFLYHDFAQGTARIHTSSCPHAKAGVGHGGETGRSGGWREAASLEEAVRVAEELAPNRASKCNICLEDVSAWAGDSRRVSDS